MKAFFLICTLLFICAVESFEAVPLLVSSHRLVRGLKDELDGTAFTTRQLPHVATNMIKRLVTECSSDEYVILDIPGLRYDDLNEYKKEDWPFLTKYVSMSSTVVGLPWVNDVLDLDHLENYIVNTCDAELLTADNEDEESVNYIDARKKVIHIKFNDLSEEDKFERVHQIRKDDEFIRKIIRKLPSPHYTIILTSSKKLPIHPAPQSVVDSMPKKFNLFNSIVNDPRRANEVELNDRFHVPEPNWNPNKNTNHRYLRNKKKNDIKFLDYELWLKNEKLLITVFIMILSIFSMKILQLFNRIINNIKTGLDKRPIIREHEKHD